MMLRLQSRGFQGMFVACARGLPASVNVFIFVNEEKAVGGHVPPRYDCFRHSGRTLPSAEGQGAFTNPKFVPVGRPNTTSAGSFIKSIGQIAFAVELTQKYTGPDFFVWLVAVSSRSGGDVFGFLDRRLVGTD
jgi:hypothetical protein